jgi:hypothetical protein
MSCGLYDSLWHEVANFLNCKELSCLCQCKPFLQDKLYQKRQWVLNDDIPLKWYPHVRFLFIEDIPNKPIPPNVKKVGLGRRPTFEIGITELPDSVEEIVLSSGDSLLKWPPNLKKLVLFYYKTPITIPSSLICCIFMTWSESVKQMIIQTQWNDDIKFAKVYVQNNEIILVEICTNPNVPQDYNQINSCDGVYINKNCANCQKLCMCQPWIILNVLTIQEFETKLLEAKYSLFTLNRT